MTSQRFSYSVEVKEHHLDTFGHVNNAVYLQLFEEARWDFLTRNGFGLDVVRQKKMGPVLLEVTVKFRKEITNREQIRIESWCSEPRIKQFIQVNQEMYNSKNQLATTGIFIIGIMDLEKRQLVKRPPPDWSLAVGIIDE